MDTPVYKRLGDTIRQRINEGIYPLGSQLPTELEMVDEFNVSRMTVSKGLTDLIEAGLIKRIRGKGTFVCSQKFEAIDSKNEIPIIKCIFPGTIYEQSFASNMLLQGVCAELKHTPYQTGIAFCGTEEELFAEMEKAMADNCAGYIIWPQLSSRFREAVRKLQQAGFPLLLLDSFYPEYQGEFIGTDNFAGAGMVVDYLAEHGHRRIAYLTLSPDRSSLAERLAGFIGAVTGHGMEYDPELIGIVPNAPDLPTGRVPAHQSGFLRSWLEQMLQLPKSKRPTAVFASHDFIAIELFKLADAMGIEIPEELSLAGFDNIDSSGWLPVPLTTVAHDFAEMGRLAARLLRTRIGRNSDQPQLPESSAPRYRVCPKFIERKSVISI